MYRFAPISSQKGVLFSRHLVGAVLSNLMEDGSERPIAYASRTLTLNERNFAQLEKEALAMIFGVKEFHK